MIEKYIDINFYVSGRVTDQAKIAAFDPEVHIPPEIGAFVNQLQPDPRYSYMHTIAMSDGDSYGSNMNGDVFSWDELLGMQSPEEALKNPGDVRGVCLPRYKTFEQAKFYKHHANSPFDDSFGDVPLAVINIPMRRIELIIRIARENVNDDAGSIIHHGAPDVCDRLDGGGVVPVSMGTRIGYEKCNYCGHENELISQRCSHLANQMGELMPNGIKIAALNFRPRFFDISKVTIPADPIALSLSKVAAFMPKPKGPNKAKDCVSKHSSWRLKWSEMVKEIPPDAVEAVCCKDPGEPEAEAPAEFSDEELKSAAACGSFGDVLSTTTAMGIVLSPVELVRLASIYGAVDVNDADVSNIDVFNVNYGVVNALKGKFAERSGFVIGLHAGDWHPTKIAESGHVDVSDFYAFYRTAIATTPVSAITKAASVIPALRNLPKSRDVFELATFLYQAGF